jgi:SagB-type dehydrogenase family enzyme
LNLDGLLDVLNSRRSTRSFGLIDINHLAALLWLCCRTQENQHARFGFPLSLRPCPSAGSIHPIHILVSSPDKAGLLRYDTFHHSFIEVPDSMPASASARLAASSLVDLQSSVVLMFVAEPGKTFAKYNDASSLIWRDAGVLLGYLSIVAQALRLSFCPLGISGEPWASQLDEQGRLVGVGMALVGARPGSP